MQSQSLVQPYALLRDLLCFLAHVMVVCYSAGLLVNLQLHEKVLLKFELKMPPGLFKLDTVLAFAHHLCNISPLRFEAVLARCLAAEMSSAPSLHTLT